MTASPSQVTRFLEGFVLEGQMRLGGPASSRTRVDTVNIGGMDVPRFTNEFWTSRQRQAASIHEVSYRACFKPQLPSFFIDLLTGEGGTVYDPFSGRGTTALEAGLGRRVPVANDINPLSQVLSRPRFFFPEMEAVKERLSSIDLDGDARAERDLSMFYEGRTEGEIVSLRGYLGDRARSGEEDDTDRWIRMVATNRLTGHSKGFFSVYTLPPNQAVTGESQRRINEKRGLVPEYRDVKKLVLRKTTSLVRNMTPRQLADLRRAGERAVFTDVDARSTDAIPDGAVDLIVTSPPFLDVVQYDIDNWLRCWFNSLDPGAIASRLTILRDMEDWAAFMEGCYGEFHRAVRSGGYVAFEVGEVRSGKVRLDEHIVPIGLDAGFECVGIVVNSQRFTKTSNIWGVDNMSKGTNTNRIVLFRKPG